MVQCLGRSRESESEGEEQFAHQKKGRLGKLPANYDVFSHLVIRRLGQVPFRTVSQVPFFLLPEKIIL